MHSKGNARLQPGNPVFVYNGGVRPDAEMTVDFDNTEIAFRSQTDAELETSYWLFKALSYPTLVDWGPRLVTWAIQWHLPVNSPVKATIFKQFCGGESFDDCRPTIDDLADAGVGTMLDYAVEARETEEDFEKTAQEVGATIKRGKAIPAIRYCVIKLTGVARFSLLEKVSSGSKLDANDEGEWERVLARVDRLCREARYAGVGVFIDAEESWIQNAIDDVALGMMALYNRERAVVFTTVQMYRRGRMDFLRKIDDDARKRSYRVGIKLVRGAYLEKEQEWAAERGLEPAVYTKKEDTDRAFDDGLRYIIQELDRFSLCSATHNEASTELLVRLMEEKKLENNDPRIEFSQLYGMGNHLTYNLAHHGYNASKYLPYGPVELVIPYLIRRAEENSSVRGQTGRELALVTKELKRRRAS
jgi:proline dehydrogenase